MNQNDWPGPGRVFRWVILGIMILVVVWFALFAFSYMMRPTPVFQYFYYRPFFFPFGFFFGILLLFFIFGTLRWVFWPWGWRYRRRYWRHYDQSYNILRERFARGEITKDQFEQMMRDLNAHDRDAGKP